MNSKPISRPRSRTFSGRLRPLLRGCLLLALPALAVRAAPATAGIDGAWRIDMPRPSGVTLHTVIILRQKGGTVEGKAYPNSSGELTIQDAHAEGTDTVFRIDWGWTFRVRPEGGGLRVLITYGSGERDEALAVRVPEDSLRFPAVLPLPSVRDLADNGLARTPPMGWNSWNHFADSVDDGIIRETADALVMSGMADAGYIYVNIDDGWEGGRDAWGNIVPNRKFPDMRALADYVHSKGLKLGIYTSPGPVTCGGYEGSYGHEEQDARTFAAWGVDYLKYDSCSARNIYRCSQMRAVYQKMGEALALCGRPMVFSLCPCGPEPWTWAPGVTGNLWRTAGDIQDNWKRMSDIGFDQGRLAPYAGPGHWNDPDMLEVGNGGMSPAEYRTHMSLWCMLAAPLIAGNDVRTMSPETRDILTNREVIAVDQDVLGRQGTRLIARDGVELWGKPLKGGAKAIALFNRNGADAAASFSWSDAGLSRKPSAVRDLWRHADATAADDGLRYAIPAHGVVMLITR